MDRSKSIFTLDRNDAIGMAFDWNTFLITVLLITAGLLSIYSATYGSKMSGFFDKQLQSAIIGMVVMFGITFSPSRWIQNSSYVIYGASIILLVLVLVVGVEVYGTKGWIRFGGQTIQPSEIAKLGTLLALASYLSGKGRDIRALPNLIGSLFIVAVPTGLIIMQPDIGSASVLPAMFFGILFWAGFNPYFLYTCLCLPIIIVASLKDTIYFTASTIIFSGLSFLFRVSIIGKAVAISLFVLSGFIAPYVFDGLMPHQKNRINTFLNPGENPLGSGYNVIQSVMAVGSGGVAGKGYLQGTQTQLRYIPMQWTDFIFSVPSEEFGFIGSALIVVLMFGLILRSTSIANETDSKFASIVAIGTACILLYHSLINIGMVIGVMPVMGLPLPFLSYGGTSLIFSMCLIGLLLNFYREKRISRRI